MRKPIKKALIAVFMIFAALASFMIPRRNPRATAQVAGFALDLQKNEIKATFELYRPENDQPIGASSEVIQSNGKSIEECIQQALKSYGKELFINDASVLILGDDRLLKDVLAYYRLQKNDHMDLPVFFAENQNAGKIFSGEGGVLSDNLAESAKSLGKIQTIRDLMNEKGNRIRIKGEGNYEIIS